MRLLTCILLWRRRFWTVAGARSKRTAATRMTCESAAACARLLQALQPLLLSKGFLPDPQPKHLCADHITFVHLRPGSQAGLMRAFCRYFAAISLGSL